MKLLHALATISIALSLSVGCSSFMQSKDKEVLKPAEITVPKTVGEATRPHGLGMATVESVGLITGLPGTGSDPRPTQYRELLLEDMKKRTVDNPNQLLASPATALVLIKAKLPPGTRKGDRIDVEVSTPSRSETTSLEGGWLMKTKLRETAVLDRSLHTGHVRGVVEGDILVDALSDHGEEMSKRSGIILGGGIATQSRPIGLRLRSEHHDVTISKLIGKAINERFDTYVHGKRKGAATPQTDKLIALEIHPRYRNNLIRFLRVIEQIPLRENQMQRVERIRVLESELLVPATSALAALRLEALGEEAKQTLQNALKSGSEEVRFYAAEALAYLDSPDAATVLAESTGVSAFRSRALTALGAMSSIEAHDRLTDLLNSQSAETRYGAFRALQQMNPRDPLLGQEVLGASIAYHEIASTGGPMVHVSRTEKPEIVVFGNAQPLATPLMILVGKSIVVRDSGHNQLRVTRYIPGKEDQTQICSATVNDLVRSLVALGASYPDIVTVLQSANSQGVMESRLVFDAIATVGRTYDRSSE